MRLCGYCESENFKFEDYKDSYLKLRSILIPEFANENFNCSLGIWNVKTNGLAKSAYDMQQTIRYTQAWHIHPEGGIGVEFNTPISEGDLPQISCECHGDSIDGFMMIFGDESNYRLIWESLEVYGCMFERRIEELFKHYTNNAEALRLAANMEATYVKVTAEEIGTPSYLVKIEKLKAKIEQMLKNRREADEDR